MYLIFISNALLPGHLPKLTTAPDRKGVSGGSEKDYHTIEHARIIRGLGDRLLSINLTDISLMGWTGKSLSTRSLSIGPTV
jgi:hypothetical protein